jgi:hypothetical protein
MSARIQQARRRIPPTVLWCGVGIGLVAVTAPLGLVNPIFPLFAVVGLIAVGLAAFVPKLFAFGALLTIVFSVPLQAVLGPLGRNADELVIVLAFVAFCTRRLVTDRRLVFLPGSYWFLGFIVLGVLSGLRLHVPNSTVAQGLFLAAKGLIFAFALAQLEWTVKDVRLLVRAGIVMIVFLVFTALGNLAAPVPWAIAFTRRPPVDYVAGIPSLSGPFQHPAAFGRLCAVLAIAVFAYRFAVRSSIGNTILLVATTSMALLTFRVKSLVGLIGSLGLIAARFSRPIAIFLVLCFGPLVIAFIVPPLLIFVGSDIETYIISSSARSTLTSGSVDVAAGYFPFGAGFGRYGSFTASVNYSPEYISRGFDHIYGLGRGEDGPFLNDTQWPAIIGETGWIGTASFVGGIVCVFLSLFRSTSDNEEPLVRWLRICGVGWLVLILIESIAAPVLSSAPSYPFTFAAAGVIASIRYRAAQARQPDPGVTIEARRVRENA